MKTAFQTGPGFYAADTSKHDKTLPPGTMRLYCARIEAYDMPIDATQAELDTSFTILFAMAAGRPEVARALLKLAEGIEGNKAMLIAESRRD